MKHNKVLFAIPKYPRSHYYEGKNIAPHVGIGYLAEFLEQSGISTYVIDMGVGWTIKDIIQQINTERITLVGITMISYQYLYLYSILDEIKRQCPDVKTVAGGPHITAFKNKALEECSSIDYGVTYEGEYTLLELCSGKPLSEIAGLAYRIDKKIVCNNPRNLIADLDTIPFPRYEGFELSKYDSLIIISTSRGCPFQCIFCQSSTILGKKWRARSAENVADEVEHWYKQGYRRFNFADDNFTFSKDRIFQICNEIEQRRITDATFIVSGVRADGINYQLLKRMKEVGFQRLAFGVESGNERILKILKKGERLEVLGRAIKDATNLGFDVNLYFIIGSPYETFNEVKDTFSFALKYPITRANFCSMVPIPDTEVYDWVQKNGRLRYPPEVFLNEYSGLDDEPFFDGPGMTYKEKKKAFKIARKVQDKISYRLRKREINCSFYGWGKLGAVISSFLSFSPVNKIMFHRILKPLRNVVKRMI